MNGWLFLSLFFVVCGFYLQWCERERPEVFMPDELTQVSKGKWSMLAYGAFCFALFWMGGK